MYKKGQDDVKKTRKNNGLDSSNNPIVRISKDGELQGEWNSISEAIGETNLIGIDAALERIDIFFVNDSMWLYKDEYEDISDIQSFVKYYKLLRYIDKRTFANIRQIDENNNIVNVFDTLEEAIKFTNLTQIRAVLKGKQKTSGGYLWEADIVTDEFRESLRRKHNMDIDVKRAFIKQFDSVEGYYNSKKIYENTGSFAPNGNIYDTEYGNLWDDKVHFIMRWTTGNYIKEAFKAMKIDLTDANVSQDLNMGNIGTFQRIAKVWCGADTHDSTEALSGRWNKEPRMAGFPNNGKTDPVFVTTRLDAVCSHHFLRFGDDSSDENSLVVVGYIPEERLGGISKINRFVEWCARRGWLQEDLTEFIGKKIMESFETSSVYVALLNNKHSCASTRGANDREASTTTTFCTGKFKENINLVPARFRG